ncbi:MAG: UDP-N-acetylmuramate--L-alanine ligase [Candidatus Omnitrophota bacterium]|nr:UDP-N-acetylmuramate--L-alanine ligase [Candidatus Omnitrophota bacterium]MDZ4242364.1 UDP-N-acetylmuramate--L-alanine ligase [Candidatus Omnitrophota bacterium]
MAHKHYHFIGIGGIGMGALASLVLAKGHRVSGSDLKESQLFLELRHRGAAVFLGHAYENVGQPDFVVYSSAVGEDNPEMKAARDKEIPVLRRAELLAELMSNHVGITVAGAHGKTSTTSMISCLLMSAGINPTTAVGGIINGTSYNANLGRGQYFVAEVDESDGSFLYFQPFYSIITNIDFEHVDYYHTWENILAAYAQFVQRTAEGGTVIACGDDPNLRRILESVGQRHLTYGFSKDNDIFADRIVLDGYQSRFDCLADRNPLGTFELSVPGRHNILNSMAAIALGLALNVEVPVIQKSLKAYRGVKRRMQIVGDITDICVMDDYGHHPTEIKATLQAARLLGKKRVVTVFQPHRYTRTKFLMDGFVESLQLSDYVIITDIYAASEPPIEGISAETICGRLREKTDKPVVYLKKEDIFAHLRDAVRPGDLVLTLGAGDIYRIGEELVRDLTEKARKTLLSVGKKI